MERSKDTSGMHKDDLTKAIIREFDGRTMTDGLGHRIYVEKATNPEYEGDSWLSITDHKGRVGHVFVGIGR